MIRTILIDDEPNALEVLRMQLEQFCEGIEILAECPGGEEGVEAIEELQPDLVFLDIEMPQLNGFDVLEKTKHLNYRVVFTTAYDQFAIRAIKHAALDYLLKPIDIEDLQLAVQKAKQTQQHFDLSHQVKDLLQKLQPHEHLNQKIALSDGNALVLHEVTDIIRAESDSNYTHIYLVNGKKITLTKTLKEMESRLNGRPFFRIHQSHIINTQFIDKIIKGENALVVLKDKSVLQISRSKKESFLQMFLKV